MKKSDYLPEMLLGVAILMLCVVIWDMTKEIERVEAYARVIDDDHVRIMNDVEGLSGQVEQLSTRGNQE